MTGELIQSAPAHDGTAARHDGSAVRLAYERSSQPCSGLGHTPAAGWSDDYRPGGVVQRSKANSVSTRSVGAAKRWEAWSDRRGAHRSMLLQTTRTHNATRVDYWTGEPWQLGTAAFWEHIATTTPEPPTYRLGSTLAEEIGACLLGGYGMPFQLANAAYERLRTAGVFDRAANWTGDLIEGLLLTPLMVDGRNRRYRFPRQRSVRLAAALDVVRPLATLADEPRDDVAFRNLLLGIPGMGHKTASWVVRNRRASNHVAIVDIHIARAGVVAGVFLPSWKLPRDYLLFEQAFLMWASQAGLAARFLDACIWGILARNQAGALDILGTTSCGQYKPVWPSLP